MLLCSCLPDNSWSLVSSYFLKCLLDCFIYIMKFSYLLTNLKKHMHVMYAARSIYIAYFVACNVKDHDHAHKIVDLVLSCYSFESRHHLLP
jgi:hypothetical protein